MYYKKYGELPKISTNEVKKPKETKTVQNNGTKNEESTDVKSEHNEELENESTSAGNDSDYQDYDQDVTDTNIEMNEEDQDKKQIKLEADLCGVKKEEQSNSLNTTMNNDVNMKECDDENENMVKQEPNDESKTFKPIKNNFCVNSFIGDQTDVMKETVQDLSKKETKLEKNSPPVSPHKIKPVPGFLNGKLRGQSPAFNASQNTFSPKSVSFRPPSTKNSQINTDSENAMFPFTHPFLFGQHANPADALSAFNNPLQTLMMQQHLNQMVSPNSKSLAHPPFSQSPLSGAPTPPINPAFNFLSSSTPNSTPPPNCTGPFMPPNFQQTMAAFQQIVKAKEQNQSDSTCPSPAPTYDDQLSPPLAVQIIVNKPNELIKPDSNAMFMKVWDRGTNICSRTDLEFRYLPSSKYLKLKNESKLKEQETKINKEQPVGPKVFAPQVINSDNRNKTKTPQNRNLQSPTTPALKQLRDIADRSQPNSAFNPNFPDFSKIFNQQDKSKQQSNSVAKNQAEMFENFIKQNMANQQMHGFAPNLFQHPAPHPPFLPPGQNPLFPGLHHEAFFHQLMSQFQNTEKEQEKKSAAAVAKNLPKTPEPNNLNNSFNKKSSSSVKTNQSNVSKNVQSTNMNFEKTSGSPSGFNSTSNQSRPSSSMSRQTASPFLNKPPIPSSPNDFLLAQQAAAAMLFKAQDPKLGIPDPSMNPLLNPQLASLFQQAAAANQSSPQSPNLMRMQQQQPRPPSQPIAPGMMPNQLGAQNNDELRRLEMMERERMQFLAAMAAQSQLGGTPGLPPHGLPFNIPNEEALRFHFQMQQHQHQQQQQQKDNQQKGSFYL